MVYERFYGPDEHFFGWRCFLCGETIDQVILENRYWSKTGGQNKERRREINT
jgi:hypothetical protein